MDAPRKSRIASFFSFSLLANHFPALHGLRSIAIIAVLQYHVTNMMQQSGFRLARGFYVFSTNIFFGMDLFFILSGFLIGTMLLHSVDHREPRGFARFYARRAFRTFPSYYLVLTVLVLIKPLNPAQQSNLVWEYTYLTNYVHGSVGKVVMNWGWSLCVEEHFYLLVPLLLLALHYLGSHRARLAALVTLWLSGLGVRLGIYLSSHEHWTGLEIHRALYRTTHTRFDILVAGILVAYLVRYFKDPITERLKKRVWRIGLWAIMIICLWLLVFPGPILERSALFRVFAWGTLTSLMYVPLILLLLCSEGRLQRFLSHPFFLRSATLGYGIYLVHVPVCLVVLGCAHKIEGFLALPPLFLWPQILFWLLVSSAAVAYVLHLLVEKPMLRLRNRLAP